MARKESLRIAVLAGGISAEREISLASGICVAAALEAAGHQPLAVDPAEVALLEVDWSRFDACFIALHGGEGEDGRVQAVLESLGVAYTGSGPYASRLAMSKSATKERLLVCGVPTPAFCPLDSRQPIGQLLADAQKFGFPLVVKPDAQGSSLGVERVDDVDGFALAVAHSQFYDRALLAEVFIDGRELTISVLDREPLPIMEVDAGTELFSFERKYRRPVACSFETGLSASQSRALQQLAVETAAALDTRGLVRIDMRLDHDGRPWVLELNTIPGMTENSLAPRACAKAGLPMPELCDRLIRAARKPSVVRN